MTLNRFLRMVLTIMALVVTLSVSQAANAQVAGGSTLDETAAPANNYDKAEFRLGAASK